MSRAATARKVVIPAAGLIGTRMIEAATTEMRAVTELVRTAIGKSIGRDWVDVKAVFPDRMIVLQDGRFFQYRFTLSDENQVQLSPAEEVVENFVPVRLREARAAGHVFLESVGETEGGRWLIRVIEAGESGNRNFYPDAVLRESVPLIEGARVFVKSDEEHLKTRGKDVRNLIGRLHGARFVEGAAPDTGSVEAELQLIEPEGEIAVKIREAYAREMHDLFGFSIDADAVARATVRGTRRVREATRITKVHSVDLIIEPGAGGRLLRIVEAQNTIEIESEEDQEMSLRARMIEAIRGHNPKFDATGATDEQIETEYAAAIAARSTVRTVEASGGHAQTLDAVRLVECRLVARDLISAAKLPQPAKERLVQRFTEAQTPYTEAEVVKAIEDERNYLARFTESGKPVIHFDDVVQVEDRSQKIAGMLDAFFDPEHKDHRQVQSFRECYIEVTGDRRVTGRLEQCDMARLRESLGARFVEATMTSATFAAALGDSITRRMLADYRAQSQYDVWRMLANVVPVSDFRTQERTRWGGFGDLPVVAEGGDYVDGTEPDDEVATYKAAKTGRLSKVTLEMIRNDDVGMVRQIPTKLSRAAKRTLAKFVLDFIRSNPVIYDTKALFHADHGNLGAAALSAASWAAARLAMMRQEEAGSADRLGIPPRNLWVPADLEEAAFELFKQRGTNQDQSFIQTQAPRIIPVWYWTDANDWAASADPLDVPTVEIGFMDGNEEPEIFVQDNPSLGSLFTNDTITYKIRHVYGGGVMDYRGLYKAVVA